MISLYLAVMIISCNSNVMTSETFSFRDGKWVNEDPRALKFHAEDTSQLYALNLTITHSTDYEFRNLYVRTKTIFPSGKEVISVTSLELAKDDGRWAGDCSGKKCTLELPLQRQFTFPEVGTYTWMVEPFMRTDTIHGVEKLKVVCTALSE